MQWIDIVVIVFGLGIFGVEYLLLRLNGRTVNGQQAALNLSLGMIERLFALLSFSFGVWLFAGLVEFRILPRIEPSWLNFALAFILVDFFWYLYHRLSHRVSIIWVAHLVHHQPLEYNFSVNFANSPLGQIVRVVVYSPMILFGIDPEYVVLANVINAFYQALLHSELWPAWVGLERFIVTPRFHQIHHSSAHLHLDNNYGGVFTLWDRLFGSYHDGREPVTYGLTKPIEQPDPFHVSAFYAARLIQNFREFSFLKAFRMLFLGPEHQPSDLPRLYNLKVTYRPAVFVFGFFLFLVGFALTSTQLVSFWVAFAIAFGGILVASGIVPLPTRAKSGGHSAL
jgi:sterol desaturase/sphingolipid hydroxylase (fatty acid hydroxylase superfamily)